MRKFKEWVVDGFCAWQVYAKGLAPTVLILAWRILR